jgi:hypothetical protein
MLINTKASIERESDHKLSIKRIGQANLSINQEFANESLETKRAVNPFK